MCIRDSFESEDVFYAWNKLIPEYCPELMDLVDPLELINNQAADGNFYTLKNVYKDDKCYNDPKSVAHFGNFHMGYRQDIKMCIRDRADIGLGKFLHFDGRLYAGGDAQVFQRVLQRQRVDGGRQHPHVVGVDAIHAYANPSAPYIARAHHDAQLDAQIIGCLLYTSRALFMSVAESTVILLPMDQLGWRRACCGVTCSSASRLQP